MRSRRSFWPYVVLITVALLMSLVTWTVPAVGQLFTHVPEGLYLVLALLFVVGYGLNAIAPKTAIPSFVWAIFFGMALQPMLVLVTHDVTTLRVIVELLAALVLFAGGVEVPFMNFKKYIGPIASISLVGTVLTALFFALVLEHISGFFGFVIPAGAFLLTGAVLASTDPTAIIPSLAALRFKRPFLRDIAVSESAVNDVAGTILTRLILVIVVAATSGATVLSLFRPLLTRATLDGLALVIIWGAVVGTIGAFVLRRWAVRAAKTNQRAIDPALFFAVPIGAFTIGSLVGGSGFLAAFVAGLLFDASAPTKDVRHFFEVFVDRFIKPIIFVLLGAVVPLPALLSTAVVGIIAAFIFMFVVRPLVVFISLAPWSFRARALFSWRELLFLSFIRETGVIPAVLILVIVSTGLSGSDYVFAVGMWVILLTLIVEPPLTPWVARRLGIARAA